MSETLKNYNQKLLAILGTLALVGLSFILLTGMYYFIESTFFDKRDHLYQRGLNVEESTLGEAEEPKVSQAISFEAPELIDTAKALYLVPVSQVNTDIKAGNQREDLWLGRSSAFFRKGYSTFKYSGSYNNIVLHKQKENISTSVFDIKIHIKSFQDYVIQGKSYLLIYGATQDSNKDRQLSDQDLQSFFIYNIEKKQLTEVTEPGMGLISYQILYGTDEIALRFGEDSNKNGIINYQQEPVYVKKFSLSSGKTMNIVSPELLEELQSLIE